MGKQADSNLGLGLGRFQPVVLGPATVPEVTDPEEAERDVELAILSALAHGNNPGGLDVVMAALRAVTRLDPERAAVYSHLIYESLREPLQRALEALVMKPQSQGAVKFPPFMQRVFEEGELKGERRGKLEGKAEGKLEGKLEGELDGKRQALQRLAARAQIPLTEAERDRIETCTDAGVLDRWLDNILGAKTAAELLA